MKTRHGFVSNSSSTSFCIIGWKFSDVDELKILCQDLEISLLDDISKSATISTVRELYDYILDHTDIPQYWADPDPEKSKQILFFNNDAYAVFYGTGIRKDGSSISMSLSDLDKFRSADLSKHEVLIDNIGPPKFICGEFYT